jgi:branched-subunit amino acid aminotransferase/4-amino-4-deoxychorismate lyase
VKPSTIWMNGALVPTREATLPFLTPALHYGIGVFEGIRCYETARGPAIFLLDAHIDRLLGSVHTGVPADIPTVKTDLAIKPVRVGAGADIGVNAVILPGVAIGKGAIVGAGAVVTEDVPAFSVVAGVPAKFLYWREGAPQP